MCEGTCVYDVSKGVCIRERLYCIDRVYVCIDKMCVQKERYYLNTSQSIQVSVMWFIALHLPIFFVAFLISSFLFFNVASSSANRFASSARPAAQARKSPSRVTIRASA